MDRLEVIFCSELMNYEGFIEEQTANVAHKASLWGRVSKEFSEKLDERRKRNEADIIDLNKNQAGLLEEYDKASGVLRWDLRQVSVKIHRKNICTKLHEFHRDIAILFAMIGESISLP